MKAMIALMMEAASTSETLVNFYQTTRRNYSEDNNLHTRHRENLKSHKKNRKVCLLIYRSMGSKHLSIFCVWLSACVGNPESDSQNKIRNENKFPPSGTKVLCNIQYRQGGSYCLLLCA
jgi:hypothetical protein